MMAEARFKIRQDDGAIKRMTVGEYLAIFAIARAVCGMPDRLREFARFGKEEVTAR